MFCLGWKKMDDHSHLLHSKSRWDAVFLLSFIVFCMFVFTGKDIGHDSRNVAWQGAAIIASSNTQKDKWMTRQEFDEHGADYIHTKVLAATDFS